MDDTMVKFVADLLISFHMSRNTKQTESDYEMGYSFTRMCGKIFYYHK